MKWKNDVGRCSTCLSTNISVLLLDHNGILSSLTQLHLTYLDGVVVWNPRADLDREQQQHQFNTIRQLLQKWGEKREMTRSRCVPTYTTSSTRGGSKQLGHGWRSKTTVNSHHIYVRSGGCWPGTSEGTAAESSHVTHSRSSWFCISDVSYHYTRACACAVYDVLTCPAVSLTDGVAWRNA